MTHVLCIALNPSLDVASDVAVVEPLHKMRTRNDTLYPGGGGLNVARMMSELGTVPDLIYLSGGETGAALDRLLKDTPIRLHRVETGAMTRVAFNVYETQTNREYRFVPEGPRLRADLLQHVLEQVSSGGYDYVVGSGSLPPGISTDAYRDVATVCARHGARFVLDTSGAPLRSALYGAHLFLVKPSLRELESLTGAHGSEEQVRNAAMQVVARGNAEHVAVSMGAEGALLAGREGTLRLPTVHVPVRSAVGAGDSFVGAMMHAIASGETVREAFEWGIAAGAAAVCTPGTALCGKAHVEATLAEVRKAERAA